MPKITIQQALVWVEVGSQLVSVLGATIDNVRSWIASTHPGLSDAELNAICDAVVAGASRHKRLADLDAVQHS